ncbi:hypothetical protein ACIBO5_60060 [Nonomuraea angiospora]|uniref:hypothetical protein n=1 Tax=Nonomuraea angiospora TaxID=46172 RepID=UPI0029AE3D33|nr:hypothetical protein [Nonomuraea angiospora]MDX3103535.1 hypothetical protein [Nonomuraea angiospora]
MRAWKSLLAGAAAVGVVGAGAYFSAVSAGSGGDEVTIAHGDSILPSVLPVDWVSYADHVAEVKLLSEQEIPPSAEEVQAGEGYIGRSGTLAIQRVLWSREGSVPLPSSVTMELAGWQFSGSERGRIAPEDSSRIESGHTYLMALSHYSTGWGPLGPGGTLPYDEGVIGQGESQGAARTLDAARAAAAEDDGSVAARVVGQPADALSALLRATAPDPKAAEYRDLPADERFEKVNGPVE